MFDKFKKRLDAIDAASGELTFKTWADEPVNEIPAQEKQTSEIDKKTDEAAAGSVELKVMRPESYEEVSDVADYLLKGCTVVLNVEALERSVIFRMLDFLNGVTYCTDGEIKKVAQSTFIITPHSNIDISDM